MKRKVLLLVIMGMFVFFTTTPAIAEKVLTVEEAKALFTNKTFDGYQEIKDKEFRIFEAPDGTHNVHFSSGKTKTRYWRINDEGEHCVSKREGKGGKCSKVVDVGNGVYHKIREGEHTHTLKNFVNGNQI